MREKRAYMRDGKALPSMAEQEAALRVHGFKDFTDDSPNVYIDRKRNRVKGAEAPLEQRDLMVAQTREGDVVFVTDASVFGRGDRDARNVINLLGECGAVAIHDCSAGERIKITRESRALLAFIGRARELADQAKSRAMIAEKRRTGKVGGRSPDYTDPEVRKVKAVWLAHQGTNAEFEIAAGKVLGKDRLPYRTAYNWSRAGRRPWPAMGSEPAVMPRKARGKPRRKTLAIDDVADHIISAAGNQEMAVRALAILEGLEFDE